MKGDKVGLTSPNGAGRATLFHVIMGLLKPNSGEIEIFCKSKERGKGFSGSKAANRPLIPGF